MITVNSVSGGKTSGYMAIHHPADLHIFACVCIDEPKAAPKDKAVLKYCLDKLGGNFIASAEHELTLKIMMQLEQVTGKEIVWVRGKSFDEIIDNAGCLPTWARRFCTMEMKILPIFEYCYFRYGKVIMNIGYRADEAERMAKADKHNIMRYPYCCNLYGQNRQKLMDFDWRQAAFPLNRTFHLQILSWWIKNHPEFIFPKDSNCRGCHHKPVELLKRNNEETPEIMEWFAKQEEKGKFNTWKDSGVTFRKIFQMSFTEELNFEDFTMCNSGGCTD